MFGPGRADCTPARVFAADTSWARAFAVFRPLSRLSYCAYLTHALVQLYSVGQQRSVAVYSTLDTVRIPSSKSRAPNSKFGACVRLEKLRKL